MLCRRVEGCDGHGRWWRLARVIVSHQVGLAVPVSVAQRGSSWRWRRRVINVCEGGCVWPTCGEDASAWHLTVKM